MVGMCRCTSMPAASAPPRSHAGRCVFEIDFDLVDHRLVIRTPDVRDRGFGLEPMSVASFYRRFMARARRRGNRRDDQRGAERSSRPDTLPRRRGALLRLRRVSGECILDSARAGGPHLSAVPNRLSGQGQPGALLLGQLRPRRHPLFRARGAAASRRRSGLAGCRHARGLLARGQQRRLLAGQATTSLMPRSIRTRIPRRRVSRRRRSSPRARSGSAQMGEWLLPYDAVRTAADPESALMHFLQTTYRAAADLAAWDRALECGIGAPRRPRPV